MLREYVSQRAGVNCGRTNLRWRHRASQSCFCDAAWRWQSELRSVAPDARLRHGRITESVHLRFSNLLTRIRLVLVCSLVRLSASLTFQELSIHWSSVTRPRSQKVSHLRMAKEISYSLFERENYAGWIMLLQCMSYQCSTCMRSHGPCKQVDNPLNS